MPFEKGHKINADTSRGAGGSTKELKRIQRQLASSMREGACADWIRDYLLEIMQGNDPRVTMRDRDPSTNRARRGRPSSAGAIVSEVPTLSESMAAMQVLLQRRDGAPARKEDLDREAAAEANVAGQADLARLAAMGPTRLRELVATMRLATGATAPVSEPVDEPTQGMLVQDHPTLSDGGVEVAQTSFHQGRNESSSADAPTGGSPTDVPRAKPVIDV